MYTFIKFSGFSRFTVAQSSAIAILRCQIECEDKITTYLVLQIIAKLVGSVYEDLADLLRKNPTGTEKLSITTHKRHIDVSDDENDPKRKNPRPEANCSVTYSSTVTLDSVINCSSSTDPASLRLTKSDTDVFRKSSGDSSTEPMRTSNTHVLLTFELSYDKKHDQILFGEGLGKS